MLDNMTVPVTPGEIEVSHEGRNEVITLIDGTELNLTKPTGLSTYKMRLLIPHRTDYPFANRPSGKEHKGQDYYLRTISSMFKASKPVMLIIWRTKADGSMNMGEEDIVISGDGIVTGKSVTIESYKVLENADNGMDMWVELVMKEYVGYGTKRSVISESSSTSVMEREEKESAATYTVKAGDCLSNICKKELGDASKWREIAELNGITNPDRISVGQVLKLK
jgi:LysM repeat protein